jgi:hypothetical protein
VSYQIEGRELEARRQRKNHFCAGSLRLSESTSTAPSDPLRRVAKIEKGKESTMRPIFRLTLLGVGLLALAVAVLVTPTALGSRAVAPTCATSQLKGKLLDSQGAAGTILFSITLKNTGKVCSLKGYPSLRIKRGHSLLPTHVVHGGLAMLNSTPARVKLKHLGRASVLITSSDVPVGSETSCPRGKAFRLRPPGASDWLTVAATTYACAHGTLHESPVLSGVRHAA